MEIRTVYPARWRYYTDSNLTVIQELMAIKNPNQVTYSGITIFHEAVDIPSDNIKVVREFINAGADVNFHTHLDVTPLHFAVLYRKKLVIDELIQSGAAVNAKDFLGRTLLHLAVSRWVMKLPTISFPLYPNMCIINKLLKHEGIDVNLRDSNGETPLMMAVKDKRLNSVKKLLRNNANPNICNNDHETPLHVAFAQPGRIAMKLLLSGADIYYINKNGKTPLDVLVEKGCNDKFNDCLLSILKVIAFKYHITSDLKQKLEIVSDLPRFFNKCCDEVGFMRSDFISGNITVHDFVWNCVNDNDFKNLPLQLHEPLVQRLVRNVYSIYFIDIYIMIPKFSLFSILQMTAYSKKREKTKGEGTELADLFSISDIINLFSNYLFKLDIFCLIVAFSDVNVAECFQSFYNSFLTRIFHGN